VRSLLLRASTALLATVICACGGSNGGSSLTGPTTPGGTRLSGTLSDPVDMMPSPQVPSPPDFTGATLEVANETLDITVTFAPSTLAPETGFRVYLDTDEDVTTGSRVFSNEGSSAIGADYWVTGLNPHDPSRGALTGFISGSPTFLGMLNIATGANVRRLSIPLSQLGGDDGRLRFKFECYQVVASSGSSQTIVQFDVMPDFGLPAGVVR
jgi:hypothetical protein